MLLLGLLWGAVFVPAILRARQDTSPIVSVSTFRRDMRVLGNSPRPLTGGRWVLMPPRPTEMRRRSIQRRRRLFGTLVAGAGASFVLGLIPGLRDLLAVHLFIDLVLALYVALLIKTRPRRGPRHAYRRVGLQEEPELLQAGHF